MNSHGVEILTEHSSLMSQAAVEMKPSADVGIHGLMLDNGGYIACFRSSNTHCTVDNLKRPGGHSF